MVPLGLRVAVSATNAAIQKTILSLGHPGMLALRPLDLAQQITALIIWNEEMEYSMKIVKVLKDTGLIIKGVSETIENEAK